MTGAVALGATAPRESPASDAAARPASARYAALDGLRGLAALAVVLHHCLIVDPRLAVPVAYRSGPPLTGWREALTFTPLHLAWAGSEAVLVFFVLSGFVVALPFLRTDRRTPWSAWTAYYPRRLLRLYLPVWAAVAFSAFVLVLVPREAAPGQSIATAAHVLGLAPSGVAHDLVLLAGTDNLDGPLWSLRWELVFSLLLPLYLLLTRWRAAWPLVLAAAVVCVDIGYTTGAMGLVFLPTFLLGTLMAVHRERLLALASRIGTTGWWLVSLAAVLLLLSQWTPLGLPRSQTPGVLGAALVVLVFLACPAARRIGTSRPVAYLGTVSFSLYLVHDPLVQSVVALTGSNDPLVVGAIALPLALVVATGFYRVVERPAHRLARAVGARFEPARA